MPIAKKLALVMGEVDRIPKNGRNEFHRYDYATEADLVQAIRGSLSKHGVTFFPTIKTVEQKGDITSAEVEFRFIDGEDDSELVSTFWGFGQDKGDKGAYKAYTGAVKYCLMKTFLVPTGDADDPEHDGQTDPRRGTQPKPDKAQKPNSTKPTEMLAREQDIAAIIEERKKRNNAWPTIFEAIAKKGVVITDDIPDEEKGPKVMEGMKKLTVTEANDLLKAIRALPYKSASKPQEGG